MENHPDEKAREKMLEESISKSPPFPVWKKSCHIPPEGIKLPSDMKPYTGQELNIKKLDKGLSSVNISGLILSFLASFEMTSAATSAIPLT